jgi:hypothetical protein
MHFHFFGTSNLRSADALPRVLSIAADHGLADVVTDTLRVSTIRRVSRPGRRTPFFWAAESATTPGKVFPALVVGGRC